MLFPKVIKCLAQDKVRPALEHAIVSNGNLVATDSHAIVIIPLSKFVKTCQVGDDEITAEVQMENLKDKAFHRDLVKELSKSTWTKIVFMQSFIHCYNKSGELTRLRYSAVRVPEEDMTKENLLRYSVGSAGSGSDLFVKIDPADGSFAKNDRDKYESFSYVKWKGAVPIYSDEEFIKWDLVDSLRKEEGAGVIQIDPKILIAGIEALSYEGVSLAIVPTAKTYTFVFPNSVEKREDVSQHGFMMAMNRVNKNIDWE